MGENEKDPPLPECFQDRRAVLLPDDLDHKKVGDAFRRLCVLQFQSDEPIWMFIDSNGGRSQQTLHLCDLMTYVLKAPVYGVVIGQCFSAATFVLLHCQKRLATPHAKFMVHNGENTSTIKLDHKLEQASEKRLRENLRLRDQIEQLYMEKLGLRKKAVRDMLSRGDQQFGSKMDSDEALELGLIEDIVSEKLDFF